MWDEAPHVTEVSNRRLAGRAADGQRAPARALCEEVLAVHHIWVDVEKVVTEGNDFCDEVLSLRAAAEGAGQSGQ